jgi:hypothetical protein
MGIDVRVESESGELIEELLDLDELVESLLPDFDDETSVCLRLIDPYGDTVFNQGQLPVFIRDLSLAIQNANNPDAKEFGEKLLSLAERANGQVHTYLKFIGDLLWRCCLLTK